MVKQIKPREQTLRQRIRLLEQGLLSEVGLFKDYVKKTDEKFSELDRFKLWVEDCLQNNQPIEAELDTTDCDPFITDADFNKFRTCQANSLKEFIARSEDRMNRIQKSYTFQNWLLLGLLIGIFLNMILGVLL